MAIKNLIKIISVILVCNNGFANDNFLVISDIHLNLNSKHKMEFTPNSQTIRNDLDKPTFLKLIRATNESIQQKIISKPKFILILGDIHGHTKYKNNIKSSESYVFKTLTSEFKNTPIIYVFGNNDSPQRNYGKFSWQNLSPYIIATQNAAWNNGFLSNGNFCKNSQELPCISTQNTKHGYFSAIIAPKLRLIALNSVLFSINNHFKNAASQELAWLSKQLLYAKSNQEQVIISMHIPPGYNIYNNEAFWRRAELKAFKKIINHNTKTIIGMLASHTHQEEIKIYKKDNTKIGIYSTAALSTAYGNSPSVKTFDLEKSADIWHIKNYTTYKFSLNQDKITTNKLYDFKTEYCQKPTQNINLCLNNVTINKMHKYMSVGNPNKQGIIKHPKQLVLYGD